VHHHSVSVQSIEVQRMLQSRPVELDGFNAAPIMNRLLDGLVLQLKNLHCWWLVTIYAAWKLPAFKFFFMFLHPE